MWILYLEDDDGLAAGLEAILEDAGYDVVRTSNGPEALAGAQDHRYDVLLTDLDLGPGMDGLDAITLLRNEQPGLPVVILSGREHIDTGGLPPGPLRVLHKPSPPDEVLAALARVAATELPMPDAGSPSSFAVR